MPIHDVGVTIACANACGEKSKSAFASPAYLSEIWHVVSKPSRKPQAIQVLVRALNLAIPSAARRAPGRAGPAAPGARLTRGSRPARDCDGSTTANSAPDGCRGAA